MRTVNLVLYLKNGEWALSPYKVIYKQHGETLEQYAHDKQWWLDFAAKWDHTEIIEFVEVEYSTEQIERLEEVKLTEEGFEYYAGRYVLEGLFPDELEEDEQMKDHPFQLLQRKKEDEILGQSVTQTDIETMLQGQKQTELEIRVMMLETGAE